MSFLSSLDFWAKACAFIVCLTGVVAALTKGIEEPPQNPPETRWGRFVNWRARLRFWGVICGLSVIVFTTSSLVITHYKDKASAKEKQEVQDRLDAALAQLNKKTEDIHTAIDKNSAAEERRSEIRAAVSAVKSMVTHGAKTFLLENESSVNATVGDIGRRDNEAVDFLESLVGELTRISRSWESAVENFEKVVGECPECSTVKSRLDSLLDKAKENVRRESGKQGDYDSKISRDRLGEFRTWIDDCNTAFDSMIEN